MKPKEKVAYVKGLIEGLDFDTNSSEGKIISALVDLCEELASGVESLRDDVDTAFDYLDELDEDLGSVEELVYDLDEDEEDEPCCDCHPHHHPHHHHHFHDDDEDYYDDDDEWEDEDEDNLDDEWENEDEEEDDEVYVALCPKCGKKVYFDDSDDPEDVVCPNCGNHLVEDDEENPDSEE